MNYNQKPKQSLLTFSCIIHLGAGTAGILCKKKDKSMLNIYQGCHLH